jgi:CBS domain-containing protein
MGRLALRLAAGGAQREGRGSHRPGPNRTTAGRTAMTTSAPASTYQLRVADLMSLDPVTVPIDATVEEAEALLRHHRITGLPVVDERDQLAGVISQTDLLYLAMPTVQALIHRRASGIRVGEVMSSPPVTINASATLTDAARIMDRGRLHRLVVIDEKGRPIGVLAAMDFVALAAEG